MEEKQIKKKHNRKFMNKRVYTPPALTLYGKLTELTEGGTASPTEVSQGNKSSKYRQ